MKEKRNYLELLITVVAIAMAGFHLYTAFFGVLTAMWQRSIHLSFAIVVCLLVQIQKTKSPIVKVLSAIGCVGAVVAVSYIILDFKGLIARYGSPNQADLVIGGLIIILVLIFAVIKTGKILPGIAIFFLLYALYGSALPGLLGHRGYNIKRIITQTALGTEGVFGVSLGVSATYVYLFVFFGALLTETGIGQFYIDFAIRALGKSAGGPAKAAVVSSCLFGSISGSAVANVAGTGVVTIPLMKKAGYKGAFAGAVEAVSSTGGQIMPPMMGAAAFIMSEIIGIPYYKIAIGALVPALIYYASVFAMVHFQARSNNLSGIDTSDMPTLKEMLKSKGILVLPLIALILFLMVFQFTAMRSAVYAVLVTTLLGIFVCKTTLKQFIYAIVNAAKSSLVVVASTSCAGIIVSIINLTGLGLKFSSAMIDVADNSLIIVLVMLMIACLILGMGLPTTPAYLILAALGAPTLITLGVDTLSAHLFVFYFAAISMVTPPVAMAVYAACSIAESKFWHTAGYAVLIAIPAFLVPYMFVLEPAMVFRGSILVGLLAAVSGCFGSISLAAGISGWLFKRINIVLRVLLVAGGLMMIAPWVNVTLIGAVIFACVAGIQFRGYKAAA